MTYRTRINYSPKQRAEMWDRWQRGDSLNEMVVYLAVNHLLFLVYYTKQAVFDLNHVNDLV